MIKILIFRAVYKQKLETKILQGTVKALDRSWATLPIHTASLVIVSTPHGSRRSVTSHLYATTKKGGLFLGLLKFTLDSRVPEHTAAEDCTGRAADLRDTSLSMLKDRIKFIGTWPAFRK